MIYVQLYNDLGIKIDEVEVKEGESILHAISESLWCLEIGDTIKVEEEEDDD